MPSPPAADKIKLISSRRSTLDENKMCSQAVEPDPELLSLLQHPPPNINAIKANNLDEKGLKNIVRARKKFFKATQQIEKAISLLDSEMVLMSRMIYKQRNQFRNDHGFKSLQTTRKSVEKCLQNYPRLATQTLLNLLPQDCYCSVHLPDMCLPQHLGLLTWVFKHSLHRVVHCCYLLTSQALSRLQLGHIWHVAVLRLAVASRVWSLCTGMSKHVAQVLFALQTLSIEIPVGRRLYSPAVLDKIFIDDQNEYLSKEQITYMSQIASQLTKVENEFFDFGVKIERPDISIKKEVATILVNDEKKPKIKIENNTFDSVKIERVDASNVNGKAIEMIDLIDMKDSVKKEIDASKVNETEINDVDLTDCVDGQIVTRDVKSNGIKVEKLKHTWDKKNKDNICVDVSFVKDLHTLEELKSFIDEESKQRKLSRKQSRTRRLGKEDWKKLKTNLISSFKPNLPNKSIKQSRKLIRQALLAEH